MRRDIRGAAASLLVFAALAPRSASAHCHMQYQVTGPGGLFYQVALGQYQYLGELPGGTADQLGPDVSWTDFRWHDVFGTIQVNLTATDLTGSVTCSAVSMNLDGPPSCSDDGSPEGFPPCTPSFTVTQTSPHNFTCSSTCASFPQPYVWPVTYTPPNSPAPPVNSISPQTAAAGSPSMAVGIQGSGFAGASQVQMNGSALTTVLVDNSNLLALIPPPLMTYPGTNSMTVLNPGGPSAPLAFVTQASSVTAAPRTIVSLGFDMGTGDQLLARQILEQHGFRGTFYIDSGPIGSSGYYLSVSDLQSLQAAGHQIGGLTVDHVDLTTATPAQLQHQVCDDRSTLQGWGLNVVDFAYPFGNYNASVVATVQSCGYRSARTLYGIDCASTGCVNAESIPPANTYAIRTPILFSSSSVAGDFEAVVVNAEQGGGGWVPFVMHHVCEGCAVNSISTGTLTSFADWLAARSNVGTVVETVTQVLDGNTPPNPVPALSGLSPAVASAGASSFTLTINGANFINNSIVRWNGAYRQTSFVSNAQLTAVIPASDVAASTVAQVTVFTPAPGGGASSAGAFTVTAPIPTITNISPVSALVGSPSLTLTVNGTNFVSSSTVLWGGAARQTVVVSTAQLTALIPASDLVASATVQVTVLNPGAGASSASAFVVGLRIPSITGMSPASALAGALGGTLTVNGTNFVSSSTVLWSGAGRQTVFVSSAQLTAFIPASDLAAPATAQVTVLNPGAGGGTSPASVFAVNPRIPVIIGMSPSSAMVGSPDLTLTINGVNFTTSSTVLWSGAPRQTVVVSSTQLTAVILANDLAAPTTGQITIMNPGIAGGLSFASNFAVASRTSAVGSTGVRVFPNPWRADLHHGLAVTIDGLAAGSEVRLFTLSGRWVRTINENGGKGQWDLADSAGGRVASGLYLYVITGTGSRQRGTLAVIQ